MKARILFSLLFILLLFFLSFSAKKKPDLPSKYKKWIEKDVVYIITPKEKEVFYKLENDRERDLFIEEFWLQRDPTPATERNEFKEEHYRRIEYANKNFGRGTPIKGWRTDRGRIYIVLGKPGYIQKYITGDTHPIEIWYYHGNPRYGQAPIFRLLFFQRGGVGEFELYDPMADGPKSLVPFSARKLEDEEIKNINFGLNVDRDDTQAYKVLKQYVSDELAEASFSSFPGRDGPEHRLPSAALIHEVDIYPHKKVKDDYAYEFLEHKAVVEVSYSVYYMGNQSRVDVLQDPSGLFFVNYSIEPEELSVDFYEDKYFTNIKVSTRVTDSDGKTIFQQERNFSIELKEEQVKKIGKRPFHLYDSFPLIPGDYTFNLLLENTVTKEFTSLEKGISVPEDGSLRMGSLILADRVNRDSPYSRFSKAYQVGDLQVYPSLRNSFSQKGKLFVFFQMYGLSQEVEEGGVLEFVFYRGGKEFHRLRRGVREYRNDRNFLEEFSLEEFSPGKYAVKASLIDGEGEEIVFAREEFSVSSRPLPESWILSQTNPPLDDPIYLFLLGNQFLNRGEVERAREELEQAYGGKPDSLDYALSYARVLLILREFGRVREVLLPFVEAKKESFGLFYYLGKALQGQGKLEEAISSYKKALSHKGNVIDIINSMGECYFLLGDNEQALRAWQKSLDINPDQERIKKLVERIKEKK